MSSALLIFLLFSAGVLILVAELFVPSHGILTVVALGFLIGGVVETFRYAGERAGAIAVISCMIGLPAFAAGAIKIWPKTWVGRRIAPPNRKLTSRDTSVPVAELSRLVGSAGKAISPLRPVGICEFEGRRVSCIAEYGMIEAGAVVQAVRVSGANLAVQSHAA